MLSSSRCCRKGDTFLCPRAGSCLTLGNELSEETQVLTKQRTLLGRGAQAESSREREPRRTALPRGSQAPVLWEWGELPGCLHPVVLLSLLEGTWSGAGSFWVACAPQPRWIPAPRILGGWLSPPSYRPLPNSRLVFRAAPCASSGPPAGRQRMQTALVILGQGGPFRSMIP